MDSDHEQFINPLENRCSGTNVKIAEIAAYPILLPLLVKKYLILLIT